MKKNASISNHPEHHGDSVLCKRRSRMPSDKHGRHANNVTGVGALVEPADTALGDRLILSSLGTSKNHRPSPITRKGAPRTAAVCENDRVPETQMASFLPSMMLKVSDMEGSPQACSASLGNRAIICCSILFSFPTGVGRPKAHPKAMPLARPLSTCGHKVEALFSSPADPTNCIASLNRPHR